MHRYLDPLINFVHGDGLIILPEIELLLFALGVLAFDFLLEEDEKHYNGYLALAGVAASALGVFLQYRRFDSVYNSVAGGAPLGFHNTVIIDSLSLFFSVLLLAVLALVILLSFADHGPGRGHRGLYYASVLVACIGMLFMASGIDLLVLLFGLETAALAIAVVIGQDQKPDGSRNATLRQFLAACFGTAILLYGFSLLYGVSASTNLIQIGDLLDERLRYTQTHAVTDWMVIAAFLAITAGMCFKLPVAPFHRWAPEVYQTGRAPVAAFISVAGATAALAMFLRLITSLFSASEPVWFYAIVTLALVSLAWGTLAALVETGLQRFLAYSGLSQIGFMLLGLAAWSETGFRGLFYSLLAYLFATAGVFAILAVLDRPEENAHERHALDGLYRRNSAIALLSLLFLASLAGIPGTAGSVAKYLVFRSLIESHHVVVAGLAGLFAILGACANVLLLRRAWREAPEPAAAGRAIGSAELVALIITAFVSLAAGLYPWPFMHLVRYALGQ